MHISIAIIIKIFSIIFYNLLILAYKTLFLRSYYFQSVLGVFWTFMWVIILIIRQDNIIKLYAKIYANYFNFVCLPNFQVFPVIQS